MYDILNIKLGTEYLGMTNKDDIIALFDSRCVNLEYITELEEQKEREEKYKNRFSVPSSLNKKELKLLLKETQKKINYFLQACREVEGGGMFYLKDELNNYIQKKKRINNILKFHNGFGEINIQKAKQFPIDQLIEFDRAGFARCLWHNEKTGSLKLYRDRNKAHCFGGCGDFDSIDIYQKINNVDFIKAVKALS